MSKAKMVPAGELIQGKPYDDPPAVQETVDLPIEDDWEQRLEKEATPTNEQPRKDIDKRYLPVIIYALIGSGLLYLLYGIEWLAERLLKYAVGDNPTFTVTKWHDKELWVTMFPIAVPFLAIRVSLILAVALMGALLRFVYSTLVHILNALRYLRSRLVQVAHQLWSWAVTAVRWLWHGLVQLVTAILRPLRLGLLTLWSQVVTAVRWLWYGLVQLVTAILRPLKLGLLTLWSQVVTAVRWLRHGLVQLVIAILRPLKLGLIWLWNQVMTPFRWLWHGLVQVITTVRAWVAAVRRVVRQGIDWVERQVVAAIRWLVQRVTAILRPLKLGLIWLWNQVMTPIRWLWHGLVQVITTVQAWVAAALRAMQQGIVWARSQAVTAVRWAWHGLVEIVTAVQARVVAALRVVRAGAAWLWNQIAALVRPPWDRAVQAVKTVRAWIVAHVRALSERIMRPIRLVWKAIVHQVRQTRTQIVNTVREVRHSTAEAIKQSLHSIRGYPLEEAGEGSGRRPGGSQGEVLGTPLNQVRPWDDLVGLGNPVPDIGVKAEAEPGGSGGQGHEGVPGLDSGESARADAGELFAGAVILAENEPPAPANGSGAADSADVG